jgi:hypothetical protein
LIAYPTKACHGDAVAVTYPYHMGALDTAMSPANPDGISTGTGIEQMHLAVPGMS